MIRDIITIDEKLCTGCGDCVPGCPEGALQIIDGKARLVSDMSCDGLGACIGECPTGAIKIEKREAEPYNEKAVMKTIIKHGDNTIKAHLKHLKDHNEEGFLKEALEVLKEEGLNPDEYMEKATSSHGHSPCGCPGSQVVDSREAAHDSGETGDLSSQLRQWPVQMHLVSPTAPYFQKADVLLAADCVAFTVGDFHNKYLKGKSLAILCPKLDDGQESYTEKVKMMIDEAKVNTLTVIMMQVPCCGGLLHIVKEAASQASRKVPIKAITVNLQGDVLSEDWI